MESIINKGELIYYYNFNEDSSCILIGTKNGFKIILYEPYDDHYQYNLSTGIRIIEMYKSSNILALIGSDKNSNFSENKLLIWDDNKKEIIKELRMISKIRIVKIIKDILFLVNDIKIYIFDFQTLYLNQSFEIYSFKKELISFSVNSDIKIAYLNKSKNINIKHIKLYQKDKSNNIICKKDKETPFIYIQLNKKGNILAASCEECIYLYNTLNGECIRDISNENINYKNINCIKFNNNDKYLGISFTDKNNGTIYIFDIASEKENNIFNFFFKEDDQYFSYYNLKYKEFIFCFDENDYILIITSNGDFLKIFFDKKNGGICNLIDKKYLI